MMEDIVKLVLPDEEQIEFMIALVDEPAIESDWQVFKKESSAKFKFKELDKAKRILMGYFMIADMQIPRHSEERGAYKVIFPQDSIDKIVRNFSKNGLNKSMNLMHEELIEGVYVLHQWQLNSELDIKAPKGFTQEADGSWFGVVRCDNDELYQRALDGELNGFSIEGRFIEEELFRIELEKLFEDLDSIIK